MIPALKGYVLSTLAAAITASIFFTAIVASSGADGAKLSQITGEAVLGQFSMFGRIAAVALGCLGIPLTLVLSKLRAESASTYVIIFFLIGASLTLLIQAPDQIYRDLFADLSLLAFGGPPGAVAGLVWWRAYRRAHASSVKPEHA